LWALIARDIVIFWGDDGRVFSLMSTVAEIEATVFAMVITFLFLLVEFATTAYSPRLVELLSRRPKFRCMLISAILSLVAKLTFLATGSRYISLPDIGGESLIVDGLFLLTVLAGLSFSLFVQDMFFLMSPEAIISQILKSFDSEWAEVIRREWKAHNKPHLVRIDRDPMVQIERFLVSAIDGGDTNSFISCLQLMYDKITRVCANDDALILDSYLEFHLVGVAQLTARQGLDTELEILCDAIDKLTRLSLESLDPAYEMLLLGDDLPGTGFLRQIIELAVKYHLSGSAIKGLDCFNRRTSRLAQSLPGFSELWIYNDENRRAELAERERRRLRDNDNWVDVYSSCLRYLGQVGEKAIQENMVHIAESAFRCLATQANSILRYAQAERYQVFLLSDVFLEFSRMTSAACDGQVLGVFRFIGIIGFDKATHQRTALLIANRLSELIVNMAGAGILDLLITMEVAVGVIKLVKRVPEIVFPILEGFGKAGELLRKSYDLSRRQDLALAHKEIIQRIDQIERTALESSKDKSRLRKAAYDARIRAEGRSQRGNLTMFWDPLIRLLKQVLGF
jgi:hypothetical protein